MFRPRHAYRSPITNRYRGKAKGCPVFNNLNEITSSMVEQHDECLESLANIKNRTELYRTLADNNKPNNNVIKSLQRLSSSASNNRLKTCLQFLIIKVNEKSIAKKQSTDAPPIETNIGNDVRVDEYTFRDDSTIDKCHNLKVNLKKTIEKMEPQILSNQSTKQQKLPKNRSKTSCHALNESGNHFEQLPSPPQDQVSSTQDQELLVQDHHDCQTSPVMLSTSNLDDNSEPLNDEKEATTPYIKIELLNSPPTEEKLGPATDCSSTPSLTVSSIPIFTTTLASTSTKLPQALSSTSPSTIDTLPDPSSIINSNINSEGQTKHSLEPSCQNSNEFMSAHKKLKRSPNTLDFDNFSTTSWPSSYESPPSPMSTSSISSNSSDDSMSSSVSQSSYCSSSSNNSNNEQSPMTFLETNNELRGPRLKLSEDKIRKIKRRPISFDDYNFDRSSFSSTPTTSSDCSPGQQSNVTQNSDLSRSGIASINPVIHHFQAPPRFVNYLKPCVNSKLKQDTPATMNTQPVVTAQMLNCAICGIKDKPANISREYGQNSCVLCTKFFTKFIKKPQQLYCAQDGDCLMTFDSRCQACWIKICLQKFHIDEANRKIGQKYSPKLLSSPNVSLITIDTSLQRSDVK